MHHRQSLFVFVTMLLIGLGAQTLSAQSIEFVDPNPAGQGIQLTNLALNATVDGGFVHVRMELALRNPATMVRGGTLMVPLPPDATVKSYWLDVNGVLIEGVPVPKPKARQVYEAIQNRNIDPGLAEYAQGNMFRTRVYPINPGQSRRLVLEYIGELEGSKLDTLRIPLHFGQTVADFRLNAMVLDSASQPKATIQGVDGLKVSQAKAAWLVEASARDRRLDTDLVITLPVVPEVSTLVNREGTEVHFASHVRLDPSGARAAWATAAKPAIDLYVDASLSAAKRADDKLLALLEALASSLKSPLDVRLVAFRNVADAPVQTTVRPGDSSELAFYLKGLPADGGSRFDNLPPPRSGSLALIVTDAMANLGTATPAWPLGDRCVLLSGNAVDADFARRLAGQGGLTLPLGSAKAADQARDILEWPGLPLASAESGSIQELRLIPAFQQPDTFIVSGLLASPKASVSVRWPGSGTVRRVAIDGTTAQDGDTARYVWAVAELRRLMVASNAGSPEWRKNLTEFGVAYGVVTPGTSLLVLESLDQYLEFGIVPPASQAEWRAAFAKRVEGQRQDEAQRLAGRIDRLAGEWSTRLAWWNKDFSKVPDALPPAKKEELRREQEAMPSAAPRSTANAALPEASYDMAESSGDFNKGIGVDGIVPGAPPPEPGIEIKAWTPDRPYLRELEAAGIAKAYQVYLRLRDSWKGSPAFFLDVGDWFMQKGKADLAARIWTGMADLGFNDVLIQRILAQRLSFAKDLENSIAIFSMVAAERPDEPQSHRDLALVLVRAGRYAEAVELLYKVATGEWSRNQGVELIALGELNRWLPEARKQGWTTVLDKRLAGSLDCDLRVVMGWDTDQSDMDLWVTEPNTFKVYYGAQDSPVGGHISRDITNGYGPEEYTIRKARKGIYTIASNYFGSRNQDVTGSVTVFATVYTNWGRPNEKREDLVLQLGSRSEVYEIGKVSWK